MKNNLYKSRVEGALNFGGHLRFATYHCKWQILIEVKKGKKDPILLKNREQENDGKMEEVV